MKKFIKDNLIVFIYSILTILYELLSLVFLGYMPILTKPLYSIFIYLLTVFFLLSRQNCISKIAIASFFLLIQTGFNIGFIYLYDSNGTFFEWNMLSQRNDAFATIEDLSLRWGLLSLLSFLLILFVVFGILFIKNNYKENHYNIDNYEYKKTSNIVTLTLLLAVILTPVVTAVSTQDDSYEEKYLYGDTNDKYQQIGITANTIFEFFNGTIVNEIKDYDTEGIENFLYNNGNYFLETSKYNNISKGNNLVYILVESFEWYVFLENCTEEQSQYLYPNLNKFLNNSVYASNFHAREKTDTSEMLALLGSNPTGKFTNYDFPENTFSWSLPNLFKKSVIENGNTLKHVRSFHQNDGDFYNRNILHESLGFDYLTDITDMADFGMVNTWNEEDFKGERNLDSETVSKLKDEMFPKVSSNEQYMTFWLTFSMHGYYEERETFKEQGYYDKLDEIGAYPKGISKKDDYLRTYAAAVMDLDKSVGIMMDKLEENGDLDNTTIVMFSDHNTYYNNLSYHAKGITERHNSELYRIPFMIYDQKLKEAYTKNEGTNEISKFTTTSDLIPTIFDLFGIKGYKNLYYGTSMFIKDVESVIFSRAYGIFITDKLICYSANELIYQSDDYKPTDLDDFIERAKILLNKQEYLDKIYYNDYFKEHDYNNIFKKFIF
jgi:phosphoglycerol transferase MdoB-like AlkP superfamily enzyme